VRRLHPAATVWPPCATPRARPEVYRGADQMVCSPQRPEHSRSLVSDVEVAVTPVLPPMRVGAVRARPAGATSQVTSAGTTA
jgi:hypothetical protein